MKFKRSSIDSWVVAVIVIAAIYGAFLLLQSPTPPQNYLAKNNVGVTVYSSSTCGCCHQYISYLQNNGIYVEHIKDDSVSPMEMLEGVDIPENLSSCHVSLITSYAVVGHVPIEALEKLVFEKPNIDGISLPNMPSGSPGMSGTKELPFQIHKFDNGQDLGIFMTL